MVLVGVVFSYFKSPPPPEGGSAGGVSFSCYYSFIINQLSNSSKVLNFGSVKLLTSITL